MSSEEEILSFLSRRLPSDLVQRIIHQFEQRRGCDLSQYSEEDIEEIATNSSGGCFRTQTDITFGLLRLQDGCDDWFSVSGTSGTGTCSTTFQSTQRNTLSDILSDMSSNIPQSRFPLFGRPASRQTSIGKARKERSSTPKGTTGANRGRKNSKRRQCYVIEYMPDAAGDQADDSSDGSVASSTESPAVRRRRSSRARRKSSQSRSRSVSEARSQSHTSIVSAGSSDGHSSDVLPTPLQALPDRSNFQQRQGAQSEANQLIVEDEDGRESDGDPEWSDDSDISESEAADTFTDLVVSTGKTANLTYPGHRQVLSTIKESLTASKVKPSCNAESYHIIFVMDASRSMNNDDVGGWSQPRTLRRIDAVFQACQAFLQSHRDAEAATKDTFSLVTFSTKAKVVFERLEKDVATAHLERLHEKVRLGNHTKFLTAFKCVRKFLRKVSMENVRLLFLSDGKPDEPNVPELFEKELFFTEEVIGASSFEVHCVAFGHENYTTSLLPMAQLTGGTFQVSCLDHVKLRDAFESVSASITVSRFSASEGTPQAMPQAALEIPFDPLWSLRKGDRGRECSVSCHQYNPHSWEDQIRLVEKRTEVFVENKPFNFGGLRVVYNMRILSETPSLKVPNVAKRLIKKQHADREDILPFCRCTAAARWFKKGFLSALSRKRCPPVHIVFVSCYIFEYERVEGGKAYFLVEKKLDGNFVKFNGNNGYVNSAIKGSEVMQAFSHYTWVISKGWGIVVDLQGVLDNDTYLLTDPQVLSASDNSLGRGNLGDAGIKKFFIKHQCGDTCKALGLCGKDQNWDFQRRSDKSSVLGKADMTSSSAVSASAKAPNLKKAQKGKRAPFFMDYEAARQAYESMKFKSTAKDFEHQFAPRVSVMLNASRTDGIKLVAFKNAWSNIWPKDPVEEFIPKHKNGLRTALSKLAGLRIIGDADEGLTLVRES